MVSKLDNKERYITMDLLTLPDTIEYEKILRMEATACPGVLVGPIWQPMGWLKNLRLASIYGLNLGSTSRCSPGLDSVPDDFDYGCTMGYDIETSQKLAGYGSIIPLNSKIISIALWCSCGLKHSWTTTRVASSETVTFCSTLKILVSRSMSFIDYHGPNWLPAPSLVITPTDLTTQS